MCHESPGQADLKDLLAILDGITVDNRAEKMRELRDAATGCPACVFTALRHHPRTSLTAAAKDYKDGDYSQDRYISIPFDWKKECADWWAEKRALENENIGCHPYV